MVDEATDNPGKFTGGQIRELFVNMLIAPLLFVLFFLGIFFVFGFTALLGGPFLFFKFLFWISLIIILSVLYFLIKIYRIIKSLTEEVVESTLKVESKIIE